MTQNFPDNTLYELDNLDVLRGMYSETVDLIATDPPCKIPLLRGQGFSIERMKVEYTDFESICGYVSFRWRIRRSVCSSQSVIF